MRHLGGTGQMRGRTIEDPGSILLLINDSLRALPRHTRIHAASYFQVHHS